MAKKTRNNTSGAGGKSGSWDEGHALLFAKANAIHAAYHKNSPREEIDALLADFLDHAHKHFREEEEHMARIAHAGLEAHRSKHLRLIEQIDKNVSLFQATGDFSQSFFDLITIWLTFHDLTDKLPDIRWTFGTG